MLKKIAMLGSATLLALIAAGAPAQAAIIKYTFNGNGAYYGNNIITFEKSGFITSYPYIPTSYTCNTGCNFEGAYFFGPFGPLVLAEIAFGVPGTGYGAYFPVADFSTIGTFFDNSHLGATLTVAAEPVPEPSTLAMFLAGLGLVGGAFAFGRKKMAVSTSS